MLKNILRKSALLMILAGLIPHHAGAIESTSAADIQKLCRAFDHATNKPQIEQEKMLCLMYLKGFLAGKQLYRGEHKPQPTFKQKALNSRAGGYLGQSQDSYCIPETTTLDDIAGLVNQGKPAAHMSAENLVEIVLKQHFRCGQ